MAWGQHLLAWAALQDGSEAPLYVCVAIGRGTTLDLGQHCWAPDQHGRAVCAGTPIFPLASCASAAPQATGNFWGQAMHPSLYYYSLKVAFPYAIFTWITMPVNIAHQSPITGTSTGYDCHAYVNYSSQEIFFWQSVASVVDLLLFERVSPRGADTHVCSPLTAENFGELHYRGNVQTACSLPLFSFSSRSPPFYSSQITCRDVIWHRDRMGSAAIKIDRRELHCFWGYPFAQPWLL